ncbi:ionotropic receptor 40a-like [Dendroctonus ponderosae]|uniref:ionotropic receptor 40a-like n=1 Tax=Dendroctonus ponderosae TaxID=77166 RepID=UPI0020355418|nr:ionotropic receptor 40a-like [Dendroctonus ponderosae]
MLIVLMHCRLMAIFEAGIITKMTENEYENLGKQQKIQVLEVPEGDNPASDPETKRSIKSSEDDKLKPINLKMLQGVFYLLFIGNIFAGLVLLSEISLSKFYKNSKRRPKVQLAQHRKICKKVRHYLRCVRRRFVRMYRNFRHDAFTLTLEYLE